jgi:hypothetical protein
MRDLGVRSLKIKAQKRPSWKALFELVEKTHQDF